jgi:hypothetical protein
MDRRMMKQWVHLWNFSLCAHTGELICEPRSTPNEIQFMTNNDHLHVFAPGCHPQEEALSLVFY